MSLPFTIIDLRKAIIEAIAEEKAHYLPRLCVSLGLEPGTEQEAFSSKARYVEKRILSRNWDELVGFGQKILEKYPDRESLSKLINCICSNSQGVSGEIKNLIFAANGPKPEIVLSDALNNTIEVVKNKEYSLVYNWPISSSGLSWKDLVNWWAKENNLDFSTRKTEEKLFLRLKESLDSSIPERIFFDSYFRHYHGELAEDFPALIPQVYLHFDPKVIKELNGQKRLVRQRMDFLMLLPNNQRIVIEIDGKQHYSETKHFSPKGDVAVASPETYAEMVSEDRRLRLLGYEVYRFGGYELRDEIQSQALVRDFFAQLFQKHGILPRSPS